MDRNELPVFTSDAVVAECDTDSAFDAHARISELERNLDGLMAQLAKLIPATPPPGTIRVRLEKADLEALIAITRDASLGIRSNLGPVAMDRFVVLSSQLSAVLADWQFRPDANSEPV